MNKLGFDIKKDEIFGSLAAAREIIYSRKLNPFLMIDDAAMEDFRDLQNPDSKFTAVVVGLAPKKFNYEELNEAFR